MADFEPDEIGYWSEVKLDILREYAAAYSTILSAQTKKHKMGHIYIDGFAGAGMHRSREHGDLVTGSPINALNVKPPFKEYHFIDLNGDKAEALKKLIGDHANAHVHNGDCNKILIETVFPRVKYEDFRRGLCVLDPYGLNLKWEVMKLAGQMRTIDMFLNFMVMDMNRNVLWRNPANVSPTQKARMNEFWGDESWFKAGYSKVATLFDVQDEKTTNNDIVQAFRKRLKDVAGFKYVPNPIPMKNKSGTTIYFLFFASQKPVAANIVTSIFNKYRDRG